MSSWLTYWFQLKSDNSRPSDSNFLLAKVKDVSKVYKYLLDNKIIVRNRSNMINCNECLRFTVGTEEENNKLIDILSKYGE